MFTPRCVFIIEMHYICIMDIGFNSYKGISPGKFIDRALTKMQLSQRELAARTHIHYQTINAIINGKRKITIPQSIKIERELCLEKGFLALLQTYFEVINHHEEDSPQERHPMVRKILFWDVDYDNLDWIKYKDFVIKRINERGTPQEKESAARFYNLTTE